MAGAVLEGTSQLLGLPGAASSSASAIRDSREAVLVERAITAIAGEVRDNDDVQKTVMRIIQAVEQGAKPNYLAGIPAEHRGKSVIIPAEYGTIYPDGEKYPVVVGPYAEVKQINKQLGLPNTQAHHIAQNAIYGETVPKQQGIAISLRGNALTEFQSPHNDVHRIGEQIIDIYRRGGTAPTNEKMYEIYAGELQAAGLNENIIEHAVYQVIQQHMEYGILPGDTIQKMPRKIFFNYKENSEDEKEP